MLARAPDERYEKAYNLFKQGFKLVDIARKLDLKDGTVRRWKSTHHWDDKIGERSGKKSERSDKRTKISKYEAKKLAENEKLNDAEKMFCVCYVDCFNQTTAYQRSHPECKRTTAAVEGCKLMKKPEIKKEIDRLKQGKFNQKMLDPEDIIQKYIDIAYSNMGDFIRIHNDCIEFKESDYCDTSLISKVSTGKVDSIELKDSMKALDWLSKHMDMATAEQTARIKLLNAQYDRLKEDDSEDDLDKKQKIDNIASILSQIKPIQDGDVYE